MVWQSLREEPGEDRGQHAHQEILLQPNVSQGMAGNHEMPSDTTTVTKSSAVVGQDIFYSQGGPACEKGDVEFSNQKY